MTTLKALVNAIIKSDKALNVNREKNFNVWATSYNSFCATEGAKTKDLKSALVEAGAKESTTGNRIGMFNTATKNGLNLNNFSDFLQVEKANKQIKSGLATAKNGALVEDKKAIEKKIDDAEILKTSNENQLVAYLADADIKKIKAIIKKRGFDMAILVKALKA